MRCVQVEWTDKEHSKQRVATTSGSMSWWVFRCRKQWRLSGRPVRRAPGSSCRDCRGDESARSTGVHSIASLHIAARKPDTDPKTDPNANSETCADRLGWQIDQRSLFVGCGMKRVFSCRVRVTCCKFLCSVVRRSRSQFLGFACERGSSAETDARSSSSARHSLLKPFPSR